MKTIVFNAVSTGVSTAERMSNPDSESVWTSHGLICDLTGIANASQFTEEELQKIEALLGTQWVTVFTLSPNGTTRTIPSEGEEFTARFTPYVDDKTGQHMKSFTMGGVRHDVQGHFDLTDIMSIITKVEEEVEAE